MTITLRAVVAQAVASIALGLLGASGIVKLIDPDPTTGAMSSAGLPSSPLLTRTLGLAEIVVAVAALAVGGAAVVLGAGFYLAFAMFTSWALRAEVPIQSCGCFGRDDTPPNAIHVGYNLAALSALVGLSIMRLPPIDWTLASTELVLYLCFLSIGIYSSYLLMAVLPRTLALAHKA